MALTKEAFKRELEGDVTPQDVVAAIVYYFGETEFATSYKKLHEAFHSERENPLFKEFRFRESDPYPYSELLESVFSRLAISGMLGCLNPDFERYTINKKQLERIEANSLKKFSTTQKTQLALLSKRIRQKLTEK